MRNDSTDDAGRQLQELDRQVERGSLFTQATLQRGFERIEGAEMLLASLVRTLTSKGVVSADELGVTFEEATDEEESSEPADGQVAVDDEAGASAPRPASIQWPTIAVRVDDPDAKDEPDVKVDCAARMHVCKAACCRLKFPLSAAEVDGGQVKWDIGHPYIIRHGSDGWCAHNDQATHGCGVYDDRPNVCRRYSCANDSRIWKDFDNMVLNEEWMDEHVGANVLHVSAALPSMEQHDPSMVHPS